MDVPSTSDLEESVTEQVAAGLLPSSINAIGAGIQAFKEKDETYALRLQELCREIDRGIEAADHGELVDGPTFMENLRLRHESRM